MLDLHTAYDATGSTDTVVAENNANAVIPANDGATTIGVSPWTGAILCAFGVHTVSGKAVVTLGLKSNNIVDPVNQLADTATGTDTALTVNQYLQAAYTLGPNLVTYAQEAAGAIATYKIDYIGAGTTAPGADVPAGLAQYSVTASGGATAGTYQTTAFNPSPTPPIGSYAILGLKMSNLAQPAVVRFAHTDFAGALPGFPVVDTTTGTLTYANLARNVFADPTYQGRQFVRLGQLLGKPCCPVFRIQGQGTGLNLQLLTTGTDTVTYGLDLQKLT